jgi:AraC family transcriptional regulator
MQELKPRIEIINEKKLVGINAKMSVAEDKTAQLWGQFGPRTKEIENRISTDKISLQIYPDSYFAVFNPAQTFEKWACVEVSGFGNILEGMKSLTLQGGKYAVFNYKGSGSDKAIFQYIFSEWLPHSCFEVDDRPHFEVLGAQYKNNDPNSEEEIWIPVRMKS